MQSQLNPTEAKAELQLWQQQGKNLLALLQLKRDKGYKLLPWSLPWWAAGAVQIRS